MAKRRKVIHVASGKVFNTAAEAERAFKLPNSVLSEAIRLGKPCHGEIFKFVDDIEAVTSDEKAPLPKPASKSFPSNNSIKDSVFSQLASVTTKNPPKYDGSPTDKRAASAYFNSIGYDTEVIDGVVYFYSAEFADVVKAVNDAGYDASWGCTLREKVEEDEEEKE